MYYIYGFELLDKVGPINFRDGKNNVFTFRNIFYKLTGDIVLGGVKYIDRMKLRRKYLIFVSNTFYVNVFAKFKCCIHPAIVINYFL